MSDSEIHVVVGAIIFLCLWLHRWLQPAKWVLLGAMLGWCAHRVLGKK